MGLLERRSDRQRSLSRSCTRAVASRTYPETANPDATRPFYICLNSDRNESCNRAAQNTCEFLLQIQALVQQRCRFSALGRA